MAEQRRRGAPRTKPVKPHFSDLRFGRLDAHDEASHEPELLLEGFFDFEAAAAGIAAGSKFLLLGTKGAGKSAVLEHLRLAAETVPDEFFSIWDLREFPIADVRNMKMGESPGLGRTQNAWEFVLLLRVIESLYTDQAVVGTSDFQRLRDALVHEGLLAGGWKTRVLNWSRTTVKVNLSLVELGIELASTSVHLFHVAEVLKEVLPSISIPNPHMVALDGLDSFFFETDNQWESLGGLVQAAEALNRFFRARGMSIGLVLALRSDIYNVLSSAETNKFRDYAVELDWSAEAASFGSPLWTLMETKARVGNPGVTSLTSDYLAERVPIGRRGGTATAPAFVLEHTRLLPRDLVALLGELQRVHPGQGPIPGAKVLEGVTRYCETYFEGEIFNNLAGVLPTASDTSRKIAAFRDAMRTVQRRFFSFDEVQGELEGQLSQTETTHLLRQMFDVGAIGVRTGTRSITHTDFVYRKVGGSGFTKRHGFVLHNALTRAWNRPWS